MIFNASSQFPMKTLGFSLPFPLSPWLDCLSEAFRVTKHPETSMHARLQMLPSPFLPDEEALKAGSQQCPKITAKFLQMVGALLSADLLCKTKGMFFSIFLGCFHYILKTFLAWLRQTNSLMWISRSYIVLKGRYQWLQSKLPLDVTDYTFNQSEQRNLWCCTEWRKTCQLTGDVTAS